MKLNCCTLQTHIAIKPTVWPKSWSLTWLKFWP